MLNTQGTASAVRRCNTGNKRLIGNCYALVYERTINDHTLTYNALTHKPHTCGEDDRKEVSMKSVMGTQNESPKEKTMNNTLQAKVVRKEPARKDARDLQIGQIGIFTEGLHKGAPLLRTYDNFVLLTDPSQTWHDGDYLYVEQLQDGDTVTLTVNVHAKVENDSVIFRHLQAGNIIAAIKARREQTGETLMSAKLYVENYRDRMRHESKLHVAPLSSFKPWD